jgi:hypothetical protein
MVKLFLLLKTTLPTQDSKEYSNEFVSQKSQANQAKNQS